jgi:hypothetical protein
MSAANKLAVSSGQKYTTMMILFVFSSNDFPRSFSTVGRPPSKKNGVQNASTFIAMDKEGALLKSASSPERRPPASSQPLTLFQPPVGICFPLIFHRFTHIHRTIFSRFFFLSSNSLAFFSCLIHVYPFDY